VFLDEGSQPLLGGRWGQGRRDRDRENSFLERFGSGEEAYKSFWQAGIVSLGVARPS
jgi:hypothetical protein